MSDRLVIDVPLEDDPYTIANLRPATPGLPMVVWVSERGNAQHDVRVKVCCVHGDKMQPDNTAGVSVRPHPQLAAGNLSDADLQAVSGWIDLNSRAIVDYWEGNIDTAQLIQMLRPLNPPIAP